MEYYDLHLSDEQYYLLSEKFEIKYKDFNESDFENKYYQFYAKIIVFNNNDEEIEYNINIIKNSNAYIIMIDNVYTRLITEETKKSITLHSNGNVEFE